jgi:hypothetical protein
MFIFTLNSAIPSEILEIQAPFLFLRDMSLFSICCSSKCCLSGRCPATANDVCKEVYIFGMETFSLTHVL